MLHNNAAHFNLQGRSVLSPALRQAVPQSNRRWAMPAQCSIPPQQCGTSTVTRRTVLGATLGVLSLAAFQSPALADTEVPKAYNEFAVKLIQSLEDAILADVNGAEEREVRRKADPAKNLVREFVQQWRDAPVVQDEESHRLISDSIQQLGEFYQRNGARARLSEDLGSRLLQQLKAAEDALPPQQESKLFPFPF